ncbi:hypothetical protein F5Y10DRAFT_288249 [Nemania abortiva]|nr:hypothetical protein F5Y10DRAFT_288249 [Nemania abortiva]
MDIPIHSLAPLRELNAYRQCLGLGPSKNLISSAIYDYDPSVVADYYESHPFPWDELDIGPFIFERSPLWNSTSCSNNQGSSYYHSNTQPSTPHQSNGSVPSTNSPG